MGIDPRTIKDPVIDFCPCCGCYSFANNYECGECGFIYDPIDPFAHTVKSAVESYQNNWEIELQRKIWNAYQVEKKLKLEDRNMDAWIIRDLLNVLSENYKRVKDNSDIKIKTFPQKRED